MNYGPTRVTKISLTFILASLSFTLWASDVSDEMAMRQPVITVPRDVSTIQEALNLIPNGGRVVVQSGRYEGHLTIRGKNIDLVGDGQPQIVGAVPERIDPLELPDALVNYVAGGGGSIRGFTFIGGEAAISGLDEREPPGTLVAKDITIQSSGQGILWTSSGLTVDSATITDILYHAIVAERVEDFSLISSSISNSALGVGALIIDSGCNGQMVEVNDSSFAFNALGGIFLLNSCVSISNPFLFVNEVAGIHARASVANIKGGHILGTAPSSFTGKWGDGVTVLPGKSGAQSFVSVEGTTIEDSARAGISNFGSHADLKNVLIQCYSFELEGENLAPGDLGVLYPSIPLNFSFTDSGGNYCGCPTANGACVTSSYAIEPPEDVAGVD